MEVVLLEDVKALGKKGQVVKVNDGYARNFILPKKLGVEATSKNLNDLKLQKANAEKIAAEQLAEAKKLAEEIDKMSTWEGSQLNEAKEILAYELTKLVHGEEEANKAQEAARALFGGSGSSENMPATQLPEARFTDGKIGAIELLVACGLCASNGEARRLIQQGGVAVNDQKVASIDVTFDQAQFAGDGVVIKKGKKVFHRAYTA